MCIRRHRVVMATSTGIVPGTQTNRSSDVSIPEGGENTVLGQLWFQGHPFHTTELNTFQVSDFTEIDQVFEESDNDASLLTSVRDALQRKYNKFTSIVLDADDFPTRFFYHNETEKFKPNYEEYSPVLYITFSAPFHSCSSIWQKLDVDAQDKLYSILCCVRGIFRRVVFDYDCSSWVLRTSAPRPEEAMSHITYYGATVDANGHLGPNNINVMEHLARGRSPDEIKRFLKTIQKVLSYHKMEDVWQLALTAGMKNGLGRIAVYVLLDHVAGLICGLNPSEVFNNTVPKIAILNVTSSTAFDGFSIVSSPVPARTRSSASVSTPTTSSPPAKRKRKASGGSGDASSKQKRAAKHKKHASSSEKVVTWPCHNRQYVDMSVVCMDGTSGVAKYLLLVEIHSRGKSLFAAKRKFISEIVHTLQAQNIVFGLFFREGEVLFITGRKLMDGKIHISEQKYVLEDLNMFSVKNFQVLIMDIFSCIIYGIKHIDA